MRTFLAFITLLMMSQTTVWGQVIVGNYRLSSTGKDYAVVVDDMQNRYKGRSANRELKKCQIYLQVESKTPGIEAYIQLSSGDINGFIKDLKKRFDKRHCKGLRVKVGDSDVDLFMKGHNDVIGKDIYGYESGQDFDIYYERNNEYQVFLTYLGEPARSEGDDGIAISGWSLIISNQEEIQAIDELLRKAQAMIKNNRADL